MQHYDHGTSIHDSQTHPHVADTVLMVRPYDFAFNEQTATDNEFQNVPVGKRPEDINQAAMEEFEKCVCLLRDEGVKVIVLEKNVECNKRTPDAVFPNNWISTHADGNVLLYPMATLNRRDEALRSRDVQKLLHENGFIVRNVIQIGRDQEDEQFLEGTGSMVIDHINRTVYGALSIRTNVEQLDNYIRTTRYYKSSMVFDTRSSSGMPFYHTNVMMSIGDNFAVVCTDCIVDNEKCSKQQVLESLKRGGRDVIEISLEQAEKFFCGNILQLQSASTGKLIVMSESCLKGFTQDQLQVLTKHGKIVAFPIAETIEFVGGGSARCMLAEVFLPTKRSSSVTN